MCPAFEHAESIKAASLAMDTRVDKVLMLRNFGHAQAEAAEAEQPGAAEHAPGGQQQRGHAAARRGHPAQGGAHSMELQIR